MSSIGPLVFNLFKVNKPKELDREQFSNWLSGFIDGEGNFQAFIDRVYVRVVFRIVLHVDDLDILYRIQAFLKAGTVRVDKYSCIYSIYNLEDLSNKLFPVLDKHNLITTKLLDYLDFKNLTNILINSKTSRLEGEQLFKAKNIIENMNFGRKSLDLIDIPFKSINAYWLLGLIEAEGTFGFKNLIPYFQIGLHSKNLYVLNNIINYIKILPKGFHFSKFNTILNLSKTLNKKTNVTVISLTNIDGLHDYLVPFLLTMPFQTRKNTDFLYWCLGLYLHKFGYFYVPEGKNLVLDISISINKARYSNNPDPKSLPNLEQINNVIDIKLPIELLPELTHLNLGHKYSKLFKFKSIWVYDNGNLVTGSPFNSYSEAQAAIGISKTSLAISRNIDTNKLYLNRFSFYSKKK